jgi:hypothetical protein
MLRTGGEDRIRGRSRGLLWVMIPSLDIRRGESADLPSVLALLEAAGLPTADLTSVLGLQMWVLEAKDSVLGVTAPWPPYPSDELYLPPGLSPAARNRRRNADPGVT